MADDGVKLHDDLREVMGLLPCPFCGAPVDQDECPYPSGRRTSVDGRAMYVVNCTNNECGGQCLGWGADGARKAWNTRPALLARQEGEEVSAFGGVRSRFVDGMGWVIACSDVPQYVHGMAEAARSGGGG